MPVHAALRAGCSPFAVLNAILFLGLAGCAHTTTETGFKLDRRFRPDITRVACFVDKRTPWLNFEDPPRNIPGGIKITTYLTSPHSALGVFGDGTFLVDLYRVDRTDGEEKPVHLRRWQYNTEEAYEYGFREKQRAGWGYQFRLDWGDEDVLGKEVMFIVSFERHDGGVIRGKRLYFKVPHKV